eukprot:2010775-Rhodomonas_salina.3
MVTVCGLGQGHAQRARAEHALAAAGSDSGRDRRLQASSQMGAGLPWLEPDNSQSIVRNQDPGAEVAARPGGGWL